MKPTMENIEHVFYSGEFAQTIWQRSKCCSKYDSESSSINRFNILITFNIFQVIKARFKSILSESWEDVCLIFD
ncbi:hypothetical protein H5410_015393 [Solanum commersonii]|uniref:Uncharacterized protein n=1 Tax=Solanum commersonii TaxID=4109 RepID=A0A9J5ZTM7_SOLCO|nr:hypothetical protein H5410_015393 [Solanum commersonii]